ncbi:transposable element Tcb1 transposase, partial [Trichonephila clavipes]
VDPRIESVRAGVNKMVIRSEGAVEYVMVGVSRRPTQAIWRGKEIEPVQLRLTDISSCRRKEADGSQQSVIAQQLSTATGRQVSRFTVARHLHKGGLFARRPERCLPLKVDHRRHRLQWCRENKNWTTVNGIVSSLRMRVGSVPEAILNAGSVNGDRYCEEVLLPLVRLFRGAIGPDFMFMDDNARPHRTLAAEELLESEDITRMD